ncbi:hypothetical protein JCM8547_002121, partial [Rhodosporidiobolus lusitaniae]
MRRNQKHNAICNSPVVRSFIKPVVSIIPASLSASSATSTSAPLRTQLPGKNPYLAHLPVEEQGKGVEEDTREEGPWMIPTQPLPVASSSSSSSSDAKGKKRALDQVEQEGEEDVVGYDEEKGTRFGVQVRFREGEGLPEELEKYWAQRYRLFSLFDSGCEMDREGWYSVTPEAIAAQIAERCRCGTIVDAFCGVGGNAIQFAFTCERVIALDTSPIRLACARRNAEIYEVADRITFILGDWVEWAKDYAARAERGEVNGEEKVEVVFLSPPWGGIDYQTLGAKGAQEPAKKKPRHSSSLLNPSLPLPATPTPSLSSPSSLSQPLAYPPPSYPLSALAPLPGPSLFRLARQITPNVAFYLPRNTDLLEIARLPDAAPWEGRKDAGGKGGKGERERVEVEEEWMGWKLKAVTAYFGELAVGWKEDVE